MPAKSRKFYVVYSPRGFANELEIREFGSVEEARDFRSEVENDVNSWTVKSTSATHRSMVRNYKKVKALGA